ncbi:hypothetical protein [Acidithiobacillus thiooxidans]|uniref:hypothetical protein n=1 Tax=Acidithiobacillus thiooxidans TaxID=930 RepID=UPI0004E11D7A|nr:hypothetical protein [Acidithiobacillus thiooxidans]
MLSEKQIVWLNRMDWSVAVASLGYGIYEASWIWTGFGLLAFPLAWWNPTARFHRYALRKMIKRTQTQSWRQSPERLRPAAEAVKATSGSVRPARTYVWKVPPLNYSPWPRDDR